MTNRNTLKKIPFREFTKQQCVNLATKYHAEDPRVLNATETLSPEQFLRLFVTAHGMPPVGTWASHTYARFKDSETQRDHFFLIPLPSKIDARAFKEGKAIPRIQMIENRVWIDDMATPIYAQSIPYTNKDWYFHYNPNREDRQFVSATLNLSPKCPEKCVLCAGARTGRVNNGQEFTLDAHKTVADIVGQYPLSKEQLDILAVVTGCFDSFETLHKHLAYVKEAVEVEASPSQYRVLEHNVNTPEQFEKIVGELGFDVWVTLECFDDRMRKLALSGRVGRKGRPAEEFVDMLEVYADYLEANPQLGRKYIHVTYLMGIDSLEVSEKFFTILARINRNHKNVQIVPWVSIFTPYEAGMFMLQRKDFSMGFLIEAQNLCIKYFGKDLMESESGGTGDGYARGLF